MSRLRTAATRWRSVFSVLAFSLGVWIAPVAERSIDTAIAGAIASYNANSGSTFDYVEVGRTLDPARGGVVYMRLFSKETGQEIPGIVEWLVLLPDGAGWRALFPGDAGYTAAFRQLPASVNEASTDAPWRETADPDVTAQLTLDDYHLPWEDAGWATVTRSYGEHGNGKIDFDLTGRLVTAAKDGVIVYASDRADVTTYDTGAWWYWNTVIIEHGPNEYSLYGHLAPNSIPDAIKAACSDDFSRPNCAVPVSAGDVIGAEGNTGYSINPHLHIELGQGFGIAAYPDMLDAARDGDRREPVYGGYVYAEHNVAFRGYTPDAVGDWPWGHVEQAYHGPLPAVGANLVANGDFSAGNAAWTPAGQLNWQVADGVMRLTRLRTSAPPNWASMWLDLNTGVAAGMGFEVTLNLGNASPFAKTVEVVLHSAAGRHYGDIACTFAIPASAPLQLYRLRGATNATWAQARLQLFVDPPDGAPAVLVDDVRASRVDGLSGTTECLTPDDAPAT